MIQVENLSKSFAGVRAVDGVSFRVEKGKIWGFLGPNGAGKTTTMRILTGYLPANEGRATINGLDVSGEDRAVRRMVGYLPEVVPSGELTVKEYLRFVAELHGWRKRSAPSSASSKTNCKASRPFGRTSPAASASAWASPRPSSTSRRYSSSTSRPAASTPPRSSRSAR
jgi:ABC-type branched-subunit amino acid transport system ATPase component